MRIIFLLLLSLASSAASCQQQSNGADGQKSQAATLRPPAVTAPAGSTAVMSADANAVAHYSYEVVNTYPHDPAAYTQGLAYHDGFLYESTGRNGASSLRKVELATGKVVQKKDVAAQYFAEGMTILKDRVYQVTWQTQKGFVYDLRDFKLVKEFSYSGEGWGLADDDDKSLLMSDGTSQIRALDPQNLKVKKTLDVIDRGMPLSELNELEYVKGIIFANVWQTDQIVQIDPATGKIIGWLDLAGLLPAADRGSDIEAVLNGIAYDAAQDRLFVTGKLWPKLFEIRLKKR